LLKLHYIPISGSAGHLVFPRKLLGGIHQYALDNCILKATDIPKYISDVA